MCCWDDQIVYLRLGLAFALPASCQYGSPDLYPYERSRVLFMYRRPSDVMLRGGFPASGVRQLYIGPGARSET